MLRLLLFLCALSSRALGCDLAMVLAVDVSGSVDEAEYRIQMEGLGAGLRDPLVAEALVNARAELALLQWTGATRQRLTIEWTPISSFAGVEAFARAVTQNPRVWRNYSTAIGEALEASIDAIESGPQCARRVIDLSGDGPSNEGLAPRHLRARLKRAGITVNAIAIEQSEPDLTAYFFEEVIWGEGAFVETAVDFADYPAKIRRKLLREVVRQTARSAPIRRPDTPVITARASAQTNP